MINKIIKYFNRLPAYDINLIYPDDYEDDESTNKLIDNPVTKSTNQSIYWNYLFENIKNYFSWPQKTNYDVQLECPICFENNKTIAMIPCGHTFCNNCKHVFKLCPLCRTAVTGYIKIYI